MHTHHILFVLIVMSYLVYSEKRDDILLHKLGTYTQGNIEKTYWLPRHIRAQWYQTRPFCKAHGFDVLTISTLDEFDRIAEFCEENKHLFVTWFVHIGGVTKVGRSRTNWYWITTNEKISYDPPWRNGQPDYAGNNEFCLSLTRDDGFKFNDIPCYGSWEENFICESVRHLDTSEEN